MRIPELAGAVIVAMFSASLALAQTPTVLENGPHHRVVEHTIQTRDASGQLVPETHRYTELATGLNYWDEKARAWVESQEAFEITAQGAAVAQRGQHKVIISPNINDAEAVQIQLPDGQWLSSNPAGLSYFDRATGESVLVAQVKDCIGELVAPNVILFPDAFDNVHGAIKYVYTRAGFEQFVVLYENPGSPAEWGFADENTVTLECYTEFYEPPAPEMTIREYTDGLSDDRLMFGQMMMGDGTAFIETEEGESVQVLKNWVRLEDRDFLIETIPYADVRLWLEQMPPATFPEDLQGRAPMPGRAELIAKFLPHTTVDPESLLLAKIEKGSVPSQTGLVIDYDLSGTITNFVFQGDTTYYIVDPLYLYETTVLEGGAVLKFKYQSRRSIIRSYGPVECETSLYRPAVLTAEDDNSVGSTISGSSGSPGSDYYSSAMWTLYDSSSGADLRYIRVKFGARGFSFYGGDSHRVSHCQFIRCDRPLYGSYSHDMTLEVNNVLFQTVKYDALYGSPNSAFSATHVTANEVNNLVLYTPLNVTNSVISSTTNCTTTYTAVNSVTNATSSAFQTVGAGSHYLASASSYRDVGTTNIDWELLSELAEMTTYPPVVMTNDLVSNTILGPRDIRDAEDPDLGYHYPPIDYCWNDLNLTNATLTLTNGVAVATYAYDGLLLRRGAKFVSEGKADSLNRLIRHNTVQEQGQTAWDTGSGTALLTVPDNATPYPEVDVRFTEISVMPQFWTGRYFVDGWVQTYNTIDHIAVSHSHLRGIHLLTETFATGVYLNFTNNIFERCSLDIMQGSDGYYTWSPVAVDFYNNLFWGGTANIEMKSGAETWTVKDNLFDNQVLTNVSTYSLNSGYNGYASGLTALDANTNNVTGLVPDYQPGPLGNFYYPAAGGATSLASLIDKGSRDADEVGLYHFTTSVAWGPEEDSKVDIGFHYAATEPSGLLGHWPLDEGTGTATADLSRFSKAGTLTGVPSWIAGEIGPYALSFDGVNDYVQVGAQTNLNVSSAMTMSAWVYNSGSGGIIVNKEGEYEWAITSGTIGWAVANSNPGWAWKDTGYAPPTNTWTLVTSTYDNGVMRTYANGSLVHTYNGSGSIGDVSTGQNDFRMGGRQWGPQYFTGDLDDVRIYDRALALGEVVSLITTGVLDADWDGLPDYVEDRNGDGIVDSGETDWEDATDLGLDVWISYPRPSQLLP